MLLARKGYKVLLVDKNSFPSDTISTHIIWPTGVSRLKRWGLLDTLAATKCPPTSRITFDLGPLVLSGSIPAFDGVSDTYCPRRSVLDNILAEAAVQAGVELREKFSFQELTAEGDRVTGIRGRTSGGVIVTEQARIVIGADGRNSQVAKAVDAPSYNELPPLTCYYYSYWSGIPQESGELYDVEGDKAVGLIPTNDGLSIVVAIWHRSEFSRLRSDVEVNYMKAITVPPSLAERLSSGRREEAIYGTADVPNFFRKPYGPGWALVGDAGYHKDPFTAQGISDAFRDAELVSEAIDAGLSGREPMEDALASYEERRNEDSMPMYEFTYDLAKMEPPPPEMQQLFGALAGNEKESSQFFGVMAGTVPVGEFFAPENLERIISGT
jgi:2-polyprenyl-6-methoxyphenol hydroxylase-like FAD-dependent oxidoreductase